MSVCVSVCSAARPTLRTLLPCPAMHSPVAFTSPCPPPPPALSRRKSADVQLLGFFWTASQLVMVTGAGLELHSVHPSLQALHLDATLPLQVGAVALLHASCCSHAMCTAAACMRGSSD